MEETMQPLKKNEKAFPVWICLCVFFIIYISANFLAPMLLGNLDLLKDPNANLLQIAFIFQIIMLITVIIAVIVSLRLERKPFSDLGLSFKGRGKDLFYGMLIAIIIYAIGFGFLLLIGAVKVSGWNFNPSWLISSFFIYILVSLNEEIMIRGFVLGRLLNTRMNRFAALLLSSVIFSLLHIFNPGISIFPLINILLAGILLGASYIYTRNLALPLSLHLFWNWIQGPILGFNVSGNGSTNSLLKLQLEENNPLNGGMFGFEGSIISSILIVIFAAIIIFWNERKNFS